MTAENHGNTSTRTSDIEAEIRTRHFRIQNVTALAKFLCIDLQVRGNDKIPSLLSEAMYVNSITCIASLNKLEVQSSLCLIK
jgi:hypothetical protein